MIALARRVAQLEEMPAQHGWWHNPALMEFRQEMGLPLPECTPQRVIRKGVQRVRRALETGDWDSFKAWVREQHAIYGDLLKGSPQFKHSGKVSEQ